MFTIMTQVVLNIKYKIEKQIDKQIGNLKFSNSRVTHANQPVLNYISDFAHEFLITLKIESMKSKNPNIGLAVDPFWNEWRRPP